MIYRAYWLTVTNQVYVLFAAVMVLAKPIHRDGSASVLTFWVPH